MSFDYPPSPHTVLTDPTERLVRSSHFTSPLMSTSSIQQAPSTPVTARTGFKRDSPFSFRSRAYTMNMKVETDVANGSTSYISSLPSSSSSKRPHFFQTRSESPAVQSDLRSPAFKSMRRQSRFDPMGQDEEELDDEGYGDLGGRHPLRRVREEGEGISLPGIRALFSAADHPPTSSSSTHTSDSFQTPALPPLMPNSPSSSPSTARTSRYPSLGSSISTSLSEPHHVGWWATQFDGPPPTLPPIVPQLPYPQPRRHFILEEHDAKRRRSDQPPSIRDPDEAARLRWQAQSRNASFPASGSISGPAGRPLRTLMHPPSAPMARGSISLQGASSLPVSPRAGSFDRRPSAAQRHTSIVGSQLARSFADLSAADADGIDGARPVLPSPGADRRSSMFPMPLDGEHLPPTLGATDSFSGQRSRAGSIVHMPERQASTRAPSPDSASTTVRRSSLTEIILAKSGDAAAMAIGRFQESIGMDKPSMSEPFPLPAMPWAGLRRESVESNRSSPGVTLNSDGEGNEPSIRRRKSRERRRERVDAHGMSGMDVLAESARRLAEAAGGGGAVKIEEDQREREHDRESSPGRSGSGPKYACPVCAKMFSRPSSLKIHSYSHTGERPFVCREPGCRRSFSVQSNLKRHAKVHRRRAPAHPGGLSLHQLQSGAPSSHHQHQQYPQQQPHHHHHHHHHLQQHQQYHSHLDTHTHHYAQTQQYPHHSHSSSARSVHSAQGYYGDGPQPGYPDGSQTHVGLGRSPRGARERPGQGGQQQEWSGEEEVDEEEMEDEEDDELDEEQE